MSNIGQAALVVVGTVVGAYFGNPELGLVLGSLAGSALFPTQLPSGPRISDNRTTTSVLGNPVPIVFGSANVAGTVMWLAPYIESATNSGGKGGPQQTTYSYTQSIAIGLCESVIDLQTAIAGITRIWENGTLVYDIRPQQEANSYLGTLAETDAAYHNRLTISAAYAETFTLYLGSETQLPDPTIEAVEGVGMAPAFRGLAYIVYPHRKLQAQQAQRHPNFQFEVFQQSLNCTTTTQYSNDALYPWGPGTASDPRDSRQSYDYVYIGPHGIGGFTPEHHDTLAAALGDYQDSSGASPELNSTIVCWGPDVAGGSAPVYPWNSTVTFSEPVAEQIEMQLCFSTISFTGYDTTVLPYDALGISDDFCAHVDVLTANGNWWNAAYTLTSGGSPTFAYFHGKWNHASTITPPPWQESGSCLDGGYAMVLPDAPFGVTRAPCKPPPICDGLADAPLDGYCVGSDGQYISKSTDWVLDTTREYRVLAAYSANESGIVTQYPLNPCLPVGDASDTEAFWSAAYAACPKGTGPGCIAAGLVYGSGYPITQNRAWTNSAQTCGANGCTSQTILASDVLFPWEAGGGNPINPKNAHTFVINYYDEFNVDGTSRTDSPSSATFTSLDAALAAGQAFNPAYTTYIGYGISPGGGFAGSTNDQSGGPVLSGEMTIAPDPGFVDLTYNFRTPSNGSFSNASAQVDPNTNPASLYAVPGSIWWQAATMYYTTSVPNDEYDAFPPWNAPYTHGSRWDHFTWFEEFQDLGIRATRLPVQPPDPCDGLTASTVYPGYAIDAQGNLTNCGGYTKVFAPSGQSYLWLQGYDPHAVGSDSIHYPARYPLGPVLISTDANANSEAFWTAQYETARDAGKMEAGLTYDADYPHSTTYAWQLNQISCSDSGGEVTLATIIAAICARAGLSAIDVTDMEAVSVNGYAIAALSDAVSIITPLRSIGFFDAVETGGILKFAARGKGIVATLSPDDIGAYDSSSGAAQAQVPPSVSATRSQDVDLPRSIRFHYIATSRDYENGEQDSPFRVTTTAVNDKDVSVPVAMGDTQALRCASVLWADEWAARDGYEISVDQAWSALDVGDCISVPIDGVYRRCRIVSDTIAAGILRKMTLVRDDDSAYTSTAVAAPPLRQGQALQFISPTTALFLDLPSLDGIANDAGFYIGAYRTNAADGWQGTTIQKSTDGGSTFTTLAGIGQSQETIVGSLVAPLPAGSTRDFDTTNAIIINVPAGTTFESVTDAQLLTGQNAACVGADRRWEIVQFGIATPLSATQWQLTRLLRGRRGTEYLCGANSAGDKFVMLANLIRVVQSNSEMGASRVYNVQSNGASDTSGTNVTFTGYGLELKPFAPVELKASRATDQDWSLSWIRRSRLGQELPSGTDIALGEAEELYAIDIFSSADRSRIVRTLSSSVQAATYTYAQQESDFATPPASIYFNVYQVSEICGRGTPGTYPEGSSTIEPPTSDSGGVNIESGGRSSSLAYLTYQRNDYGGASGEDGIGLEWRFRFPAQTQVVDLYTETDAGGANHPGSNTLRFGFNGAREYADSSASYSAQTNLNCLTWAISDSSRYLFTVRAFQGNASLLTGPALVQKIDTQAALATIASAFFGDAGDAPRMTLLGAYLYLECPYFGAIYRLNASDLTTAQTYIIGSDIPRSSMLMQSGGNLYCIRQTSAQFAANEVTIAQVDPLTLATIAVFTLPSYAGISGSSPYNLLDGVIVGSYLYAYFYRGDGGASPSVPVVHKFRLNDGALQAFALHLDYETSSSSTHYMDLDGSLISVGRTQVYVIDTTTDTVTT